MPLRSMNRSRLAGDDWRIMARTSAVYCLFWVMIGSFFRTRCNSHGMKEVSVQMVIAIVVLDDRFSSTPAVH